MRESFETVERSTEKKTKMDSSLTLTSVEVVMESQDMVQSASLIQGVERAERIAKKSFRDSMTGEVAPLLQGSFFDLDVSSSDDESRDEEEDGHDCPVTKLSREEKIMLRSPWR